MKPRQWQIVFHLHADLSATARIQVDGRVLLPTCDGLPAEESLGSIAAALVDHHAEDQLDLRAQGSVGVIRTIRLSSPAMAQAWLQDRVGELSLARARDSAAREPEGAGSGLRPSLGRWDDSARAPHVRKSFP